MKLSKTAIAEIESLVAVLIMSCMIFLILSLYKSISNSNLHDESIQDEIRLMQLKRELNIASNFKVEEFQLEFDYKKHKARLRYHNNHLIMSPGTIIILEDIDYASFYEDNEQIYLVYSRKKRVFERKIYEK